MSFQSFGSNIRNSKRSVWSCVGMRYGEVIVETHGLRAHSSLLPVNSCYGAFHHGFHSVTREISARVLHFGTEVAGTRQFNQPGEVVSRLVGVAGVRRGLPRAVQPAIAVRL